MTRSIDNTEDIIDSRDVIERLAELAGAWQAHANDPEEPELDEDELEELAALTDLADAGADYAEDWQYGAALIRESYFTEYAQELADDIGAVPSDLSWPCTCIDWEWAARELKSDYTSIDWGGVTYYVR